MFPVWTIPTYYMITYGLYNMVEIKGPPMLVRNFSPSAQERRELLERLSKLQVPTSELEQYKSIAHLGTNHSHKLPNF